MAVSGLIKPSPWNADSNLVAPKWRWAWRGLESAHPMWERGGEVVYDVSPNGRHVTMSANMDRASDWIVSVFGPAIDFQGGVTDEWLLRTSHPYIAPPFSILSVWKQDTAIAQQLLFTHDSGSNNGYRAQTGGSGIHRYFLTFGGVADYNLGASMDLDADVWYAAVLTVDANGGTANAYLHNFSTGAITTASLSVGTVSGTPDRIAIADNSWAAGNGLDGQFALNCHWSRVLTEVEARAIIFDFFGPFRMEDIAPWATVAPAVGNPWFAYAQQ